MGQDPYFHLAEAIADGVPIDWQERTVDVGEANALLRNLEIIEAMGHMPSAHEKDYVDLQEPQAPLPALFQWGHLDVLEKIGEGGYGEVFRAWDRALHREVALKLCRSDRALLVGQRPYLEEARRLARVRHPNVLAVHGAESHEGRVGLWCDLVQGEPLNRMLDRTGPFSYALCLKLAEQMGKALDAVHDANLVHGDLKLANLMLQPNHQLVLMDFGAVTDLSQPSVSSGLVGTPMYMAPEVMAGESPTPQSDCFALGVVLFRLSTGEYPFRAKTFEELLEKKLAGAIIPVRFPKAYPSGWVKGVHQLMNPDPRLRPSSSQFRDAITHLQQAPAKRQKRLLIGASLIFLTLTAIGFAGLSLRLAHSVSQTRAEAETSEQLVSLLVDMFEGARPSVALGNPVTADSLLAKAILLDQQRTDLDPRVRGRLQSTLGFVSRQLYDLDNAIPLLEQSTSSLNGQFGPKHPYSLKANSELLLAYQMNGEFEKAKTLGSHLMALDLSDQPEFQLRITCRFAELLEDMGDLNGASEQFDGLLNQIDQVELSNACRTEIAHDAGTFFLNRGLLDRAQSQFDTLARLNASKPENHPDNSRLADRLSLLAMARGDYQAALMHEQRAIEISAKWSPPDHPNLAYLYSNCGMILSKLTRFEEAETYFSLAWSIMEPYLKNNNPEAVSIRLNMATHFLEIGRPQKALGQLDEMAPSLENVFGRDSLPWANFCLTKANCLLAIGNYEQAEPLYRSALDWVRGQKGLALMQAVLLNNLGELHTRAGAVTLAEQSYSDALATVAANAGKKHPIYASILLSRLALQIERARWHEFEEDLAQIQSRLEPMLQGQGADYCRIQAFKALLSAHRHEIDGRAAWKKLRPELLHLLGETGRLEIQFFDRWFDQ
ncbi:MAG: serine/threonine protein kinase [Acidobacteria bacterium]|nr:serine/threonine protein kinase [Acidobacteriota bacterium]